MAIFERWPLFGRKRQQVIEITEDSDGLKEQLDLCEQELAAAKAALIAADEEADKLARALRQAEECVAYLNSPLKSPGNEEIERRVAEISLRVHTRPTGQVFRR